MTEHSLECNTQLTMILERLSMLEQMHLQSPQLAKQIAQIKLGCTQSIPQAV